MKIKVFDSQASLYAELIDCIVNKINQKKPFNIGLATGSTPEPLYEALIQAHQHKKVDFSHVKSFNLDEYVGLDHAHPASYDYYMHQKLFKHVNFQHSQLPNGQGDLEKNAFDYHTLLKENSIDLQILGIGSNGHIAFNEPGTPFDSKTHIVDLTKNTIMDNARFFNHIDEVPTQAITMGLSEIMAAKEIILIATGTKKADAIYQTVKGPVTTNVPASILQKHSNVTLYIDKEAASKL